MGERRFAKDILQEYVDGKCEIDSAFKKLIHKVREGFIIQCEDLDEATGEKEYTMLWKRK